ncbi:MAG: hypothetical protein ACD_45C00604G0003 [uncultured bacterium]|nr:MAG: hypothetical protein ACD_45C00604G0003 [uncultured bacterium]
MMLSFATRSRFFCIEVPDYSQDEKAEILQKLGIQSEEKEEHSSLRQALSDPATGDCSSPVESVPVFYANDEKNKRMLQSHSRSFVVIISKK